MQEIKCPHCGKVFSVDESGYAQIVRQVRDREFEKDLAQRAREITQAQEQAQALARMEQEKAKSELEARKNSALADKDREIARLNALLENAGTAQELAVTEAVQSLDKELSDRLTRIAALEEELARREQETARAQEQERELARMEREKAQSELEAKKNSALAEKDREIARLNALLENAGTAQKLAVTEAVQSLDKELSDRRTRIAALEGELHSRENESKLREASLRREYEGKLKQKDEQIDYYKDFKARQSVKLLGESLEQHCYTQFNTLRMAAFPNAYFEKDNDARTGSKGDFIFREASEDGTEFISIMFEMKNEMDETATKHKNEDFFRELDKDRREKNCEYAVLVSMLEMDSELYTGITDVSYRYEKMYVVRPQFFIPIITLLRSAALNSLQYRRELQIVKNQQLDLRNFEENMQAFKDGFARNYRLASERFRTAVEEIDKTIIHLQKTKEALLSSENNLRLANNKAEELSIKRLTKNAPSVKAMFDETERE